MDVVDAPRAWVNGAAPRPVPLAVGACGVGVPCTPCGGNSGVTVEVVVIGVALMSPFACGTIRMSLWVVVRGTNPDGGRALTGAATGVPE